MAPDEEPLSAAIIDLAGQYGRYGCRRIHVLFRREGRQVDTKPTDNAYIEAFDSRFRQECLNASWFLSLEDAKSKIEAWRTDYNSIRSHTAIGHMTPVEFAASSGQACLA